LREKAGLSSRGSRSVSKIVLGGRGRDAPGAIAIG
jgi:hypothetical protein